jgi:hypothetical protein
MKEARLGNTRNACKISVARHGETFTWKSEEYRNNITVYI